MTLPQDRDSTYLDHAATTPLRAEVAAAMRPFEAETFGNPSSVHRRGQAARAAVEEARARVARTLGAERDEIVFTGGGTESDNLAVLGRSRADRSAGGSGGVVCSAVEHKAVLGAARLAGEEGAPVTLLGVDEDGRVDDAALADALPTGPAVVSVLWGNNEVGTIQPVAALAARCREAGVTFHTDAVQAFGRTRVRVDETPCDLLTLSAHKLGGPKGVGVLFVRRGTRLRPLAAGGGQEFGLRPGTHDVAGIVGASVAVELAASEQAAETVRLAALRRRLIERLEAGVPAAVVNGGAEALPHIVSVSIAGVPQEALLVSMDLEGVAISSGSACQSGSVEPSHVLVAMGRPVEGEAWLRFSLGRGTTEQDVDRGAVALSAVLERLASVPA